MQLSRLRNESWMDLMIIVQPDLPSVSTSSKSHRWDLNPRSPIYKIGALDQLSYWGIFNTLSYSGRKHVASMNQRAHLRSAKPSRHPPFVSVYWPHCDHPFVQVKPCDMRGVWLIQCDLATDIHGRLLEAEWGIRTPDIRFTKAALYH